MSRDSGADQPTQRTVAELLAEYGGEKGGSEQSSRRRRRRAEDPTETAPQAIIDRVLSDSGKMRPIDPDAEPPASRKQEQSQAQPPAAPQAPAQPPAPQPPAAQPPAAQPPAQPPAQQPPAAQPGAAQSPAAQPPQPAPEPPAEPPQAPAGPNSASQAPAAPQPPAEKGGYWARRFGGSKKQSSAPSGDAEATIQQQPVAPPAVPGPPSMPAAPAQPPENATQQIPRLPEPVAYPQQPAADEDPYDFDDSLAQDYSSGGYAEQGYADEYAADYDDFAGGYARDDYADADYDGSAPAGLDDDYADEPDRRPSPGKEWGTVALQGIGGLIGGGAVWIGFRWLWINATIAAFAAALVFTGLLVLVAWKFFRTNDLQTILLSVLVGLFCTVSPAVLLLIGR